LAKRRELLTDELLGLLRQRRALVEHAVDSLRELPRAPAVDTAHLGVELSAERFLERDQDLEM